MSTEWQFLITLNEQLRPLKDPVEIQEVAVRLIGEHLHASRAHYAQIDGDEFVIIRSYADGVAPFTGRGRSPDSATPSSTHAAAARRWSSATSIRIRDSRTPIASSSSRPGLRRSSARR